MTGVQPWRAARIRSRTERWRTALLGAAALLFATPALAAPLDQLIPGLFGGTLSTTVDKTGSDQNRQQALIIQRFRNLSTQLSVARSQVPIPSSSGAFSFAWDNELDTFVRSDLSLGSIFAERAQTLGRGRFSVGFSYQHVDYSTLDGDPLNNIRAVQPAFSQAYLDSLELTPSERAMFANDVIETRLALSFSFDLFYLNAAYGLTDDIDVSLGLTINRAALSGHALAMTVDPTGASPVGQFTSNQPGVIQSGNGPVCSMPLRCAQDSFNQTAFGTGDLYLRGKWHVTDTRYADLAVVGVLTLPTGNANDFLGFHDPTFTPWAIASKTFGRISPHLNVGYAIRSDTDVSQFQWIAGADVLTAPWLTLVSDFLGYYDHVNNDVVQSSVGFKVNPFSGMVLSVGFQFPVNRDGLRADVIYTGQAEYNF